MENPPHDTLCAGSSILALSRPFSSCRTSARSCLELFRSMWIWSTGVVGDGNNDAVGQDQGGCMTAWGLCVRRYLGLSGALRGLIVLSLWG